MPENKDKKKEQERKDGSKFIDTEPRINEQELDEVLSLAARRKRSRAMKKVSKGKLKAARARAERKKASPEKLKKRAEKKARKFVRDKLDKSKNYNDMSPAQKIAVDKKLERVSKSKIQNIAKRLLPSVKKAETERMKKRSEKKEEVSLESCEQPKKRYHKLLNADMKTNIDKRFKMYKQAPAPEFDVNLMGEALDNMDGDINIIAEAFMKSREERIISYALNSMHDMVKKNNGRHSIRHHALSVTREINGLPINDKELADLYKKTYSESTGGGAGEEGTDELANKYKKDTPGQ